VVLVETVVSEKINRHEIFKNKSTSEQLGGASEYKALYRANPLLIQFHDNELWTG
jgi:hypothetical protein